MDKHRTTRNSVPLDPTVMRKASRYAKKIYDEMSKRSTLLKNQAPIALFHPDEILPNVGDCIGRGGFNNVYNLDRVKLRQTKCHETEHLRQRIALKKPKLAIKFLSDTTLKSVEDTCNGSADLLMEAKYLSALAVNPHPSIIQLHGVSSAGVDGFQEKAGFFLILDRLFDTLDKRMEVWSALILRKNSKAKNDVSAQKYLTVLFLQRLIVASEIASALEHLHSLRIVFRDLKPDNVGFDYNGRVKVFDFGLAKELDPKQQRENGLYQMSGGTGSRRYMAPEVAFSEAYGLSADMYSFAILLWEVLALEKAFGDLSVDNHKQKVLRGSKRLPLKWSPELNSILSSCWDRRPYKRPLALEAKDRLLAEIQELASREFPLLPEA